LHADRFVEVAIADLQRDTRVVPGDGDVDVDQARLMCVRGRRGEGDGDEGSEAQRGL
jgi:hypothetical protein